jgi:hypothetical protein
MPCFHHDFLGIPGKINQANRVRYIKETPSQAANPPIATAFIP